MFCPRCGTENTDSASFCKRCGNKLGVQAAPQEAPQTEPQAAPQAAPQAMPQMQPYAAQVKAPLSSHPVINAVKKTASSPLFLTAVIAYSVQLLFALVNVIKGGNIMGSLYKIMNFISEYLPLSSYEIREFYDAIEHITYIGRAPFIIFGILGLIPTILICTGLWITYSSAASRASDGMKTSGLTIIKVLTIIQLIGVCISFVFVEIVLLVLTIGLGTSEYIPGGVLAIMVLLILIVALIYVLQIIYFSKIVQSINAVKNTLNTGIPCADASSFVAIWTFISAFGSLFTLLTNFIGNVAAITALVCFGILVFKFNSNMRMISYNAPVQNPVNQNVQM